MAAGSASAGALLGIGNPLLDISAEAPQDFLDKYGVSMGNAILAEESHLPMYAEMTEKFKVEYIAGGATQNTIRVAQWMSGVPGMTSYIGCVGKDEFGAQLAAAAGKDGVNVLYMEDESAATGTCAVLIKDKERSLIANLSAANNYKISHLNQDSVQSVVKGAQIIYSAGFFLTVSPDSAVSLGKHAAAAGKIFATNLSAPFLCSVFKDAQHKVLPFADIVFGNESEAAAYAEANGLSSADPETVALAIAALPKASGTRSRMVVITQGSKATVVAREGVVTSYPVPAVPDAEIVDLNGAGDAFCGGFLAAMAKGLAIEQAVDAGHWAAGQIIRLSGTTIPATCEYKL